MMMKPFRWITHQQSGTTSGATVRCCDGATHPDGVGEVAVISETPAG